MFASTTSGFRNTPISKKIIYSIGILSLIVSIADIKNLFYIRIQYHLLKKHQWWRILIWQSICVNQSDFFSMLILLYNFRVIERFYGVRKFVTFVSLVFIFSSILVPLLSFFVSKVFLLPSFKNIIPGPFPVVFALMELYYSLVPVCYKFVINTWGTQSPELSSEQNTNQNMNQNVDQTSTQTSSEFLFSFPKSIELSDKSFLYMIGLHLGLANPIPAIVGWSLATAWRNNMFGTTWRLPETVTNWLL